MFGKYQFNCKCMVLLSWKPLHVSALLIRPIYILPQNNVDLFSFTNMQPQNGPPHCSLWPHSPSPFHGANLPLTASDGCSSFSPHIFIYYSKNPNRDKQTILSNESNLIEITEDPASKLIGFFTNPPLFCFSMINIHLFSLCKIM